MVFVMADGYGDDRRISGRVIRRCSARALKSFIELPNIYMHAYDGNHEKDDGFVDVASIRLCYTCVPFRWPQRRVF